MTAETATAAPSVESVSRNDARELVVKLKGIEAPAVNAKVARCFPWALPDDYISLLDKDGKELCLLKSLEDLDPASRLVVQDELRDRNFKPHITRVTQYKDEFGVVSLTADTDRGTVTFQIRSRDDVRVMSASRLLLRDADGNQYEVPDVHALDPASRRWVSELF